MRGTEKKTKKRKRREEGSALLYIPLESRSPDSGSAAPPASDAFRRNPDSAAGICGRAPQAEEEKTTDLPNPSPLYDQREEEERRRRMEGEEKGARVLGFGLPFFFVFFFALSAEGECVWSSLNAAAADCSMNECCCRCLFLSFTFKWDSLLTAEAAH